MPQPTVLVAGGAGFIGSYLCELLIRRGVVVVCVDNWQTGIRENIKHIQDKENFILLEKDITENFDLTIEKVDYIVHLAGVEAYINGEDISLATLKVNSEGTRNLLEMARTFHAKFLLASTIDVVSDQFINPGILTKPALSHHEAKRFAEILVSEYGQKEQTDVRIVRLGDVYGPRMTLSAGNPIARLIKQAIYQETLTVPADYHVPLYPVFVLDVVEGLAKSLFSGGTKGSIITLAGPPTHPTSLAQIIRGFYPSLKITPDKVPVLRNNEVPQNFLLIGRDIISWEPKTILAEGIEKTLDWFEKEKSKKKIVRETKVEYKQKAFWEEANIPNPHVSDVFKNLKLLFATVAIVFCSWLFLLPFINLKLGFFSQAIDGFDRWRLVPGFTSFSSKMLDLTRLEARKNLINKKQAVVKKQLNQLLEAVRGNDQPSIQISENLSLELGALVRELGFFEADKKDQTGLKREVYAAFSKLFADASNVLGKDGKKTYAILVQDPAELRPTGGVIKTIVLITFQGGRIVGESLKSVEEIDARLVGEIQPPEPIKKYTASKRWFLQDANWSPDFPTSAQRVAWFIENSLDEEIAGVVAMDTDLFEKLKSSKLFVEMLIQALEEGKIKFWFADAVLTAVFQEAGLAGSIRSLVCPKIDGVSCIKDFLFPVEANLSLNQVNKFLLRDYSLDIVYQNEVLLHKLIITYKNDSKAGIWPGGDYKNYLRVLVPQEATNPSAVFVSKDGSKALDIDEEVEKDKKSLGVLVNVPAGERVQAVLSWELPTAGGKRLLLYWQKQPGTGKENAWIKISLPDSYTVSSMPSPTLTSGNVLGYNSVLDQDLFINLIWQQNQ